MERPRKEELANALTHAVGIALSIVGAFVLIPAAVRTADAWLIGGCIVYLFSLSGLYITSTLSHCFQDDRRRRLFRRLDQAFIYLLIASTYTPISIAYLDGTWWWGLLALIWLLALLGFFSKLLFAHKLQKVSVWIYVILGWLPVVGGMPFSKQIPFDSLMWFFAGGILYTAGTVFLFNDKRRWYFHALWHLMVLAASITHFVAIMKCVQA